MSGIPTEEAYALVRQLIRFPRAEVCKHYAAERILNALEENGESLDYALCEYVTNGQDELALLRMAELGVLP